MFPVQLLPDLLYTPEINIQLHRVLIMYQICSGLVLLPFLLQHTLNTHLGTHIVWPHQPENPPGRPRAWQTSP